MADQSPESGDVCCGRVSAEGAQDKQWSALTESFGLITSCFGIYYRANRTFGLFQLILQNVKSNKLFSPYRVGHKPSSHDPKIPNFPGTMTQCPVLPSAISSSVNHYNIPRDGMKPWSRLPSTSFSEKSPAYGSPGQVYAVLIQPGLHEFGSGLLVYFAIMPSKIRKYSVV
ncbi:hypothetical protein BT63DRAFT_452280 [Microthyrium microscopicum]|uniref:Uncharacterized protein n=1 Tax=Microthyrium microscopicum TaxID=703497 RepID=A0A6A6UJ98_9PEZI|nr:hypothetical protein BT63DRAFT_452280 [Microthyrium microscopicum]